jgi:hypothetical protein
MTMKTFFFALMLAALSTFSTARAQSTNPLCDLCGITEDNIDFWRAIDPSGDGSLSTLDLVLFTKMHQALGQPTIITEDDINDAVSNGVDLNGDGVFDGKDWLIRNALVDYMYLTGEDYAYFSLLIDCLRAVILGTCP